MLGSPQWRLSATALTVRLLDEIRALATPQRPVATDDSPCACAIGDG
jgi:hypothetical protein